MFKNFLNKSKTIFSKKEEDAPPQASEGGGGFDSDEDHDIIEIGKNKLGGAAPTMPGNSLIITISSSSSHNFVNGGG
jgi:hypothetical protein